MRSPRRILIVRTDRMGDLLMSLPVLSSIRKELPGARLTLFLREGLQPLLEKHPDVEELLTFNPAQDQGPLSALGLARRLRPFRFDAALVLHPSRMFHLACFLAGIPVRIGYRRKWGFLLSRSIADTKGIRRLHEVEYNLELARLLGIRAAEREIVLPLKPATQAEAIRLLKSMGAHPAPGPIAVHPWTSNPAKGWPIEYFRETARQLKTGGREVLWIGEPGAGISIPSVPEGAVDLCRRVPLGLLSEILRLCRLLISNDSGPVHVAAAVGTPTIVVAPSEHAQQMERWRPLGSQHRILLSPTVSEVLAAIPRPDPSLRR